MSRFKMMLLLGMLLSASITRGQELFVYTEPASNMPARSVGVRLSNWVMDETETSRVNYHFIPEVMWGVNKHLMVHVEGYVSNRSEKLSPEGGALYAKYRLFSYDNMYRHTRMAAFARASTNNSDIHQEEIATNGHNSGYQLGLIGTQLLHKTALSSTVYFEKAMNNAGKGNEYPSSQANQAINYTLSAGRLILPTHYAGYKQTNLNIMVELWGQKLLGNGKSFLDIAPSVQLIFNSQTRLDIGYKHQLYSNMSRTAPNGLLVRLEHLLFNAI